MTRAASGCPDAEGFFRAAVLLALGSWLILPGWKHRTCSPVSMGTSGGGDAVHVLSAIPHRSAKAQPLIISPGMGGRPSSATGRLCWLSRGMEASSPCA